MAEIIILTPEQLAERERKHHGQGRSGRRRSPERTRIIEEYKAALQAAEPGYGGQVHLAEGEDKRAVRLNLKVAAEELGKALAFRPVKDSRQIQFRVITPEEQAARPPRGGRPRKQPDSAPSAPDAAASETNAPVQPVAARPKRTRHRRQADNPESAD